MGVPEPQRLVVAAGDDALSVGAERHAVDSVGVAGERGADGLRQCRRPTVAASCRSLPVTMRCAVGAERHTGTRRVAGECGRADRVRRAGVPIRTSCRRCRRRCGAVGAERHTDHWPVWPVSGCRRVRRCAASHSRSVLSWLAGDDAWPSGLNATLVTGPVWPVSGGPTGSPVSASHTVAVLSPLPVTMRCRRG